MPAGAKGDDPMTTYRARIMDAATGAEGSYDFEEADDLLRYSPLRVIRKFMEHAEHDLIPESYQDYELNAAFKSENAKVVTGLGSLVLTHDPAIPFVIMIAAKAADAG